MNIDIEKAKKEFIKYTENYDLDNPNIKRKQQHSLRVMKISEEIAKGENFSKEEIELAKLIGLLHDIARFKQYTEYQTFKDAVSFDHGDMGVNILEENNFIRKFIETEEYDNIIKKAIKNHNKFEVEEGINETEEKFCKIIRDADKLDIFYEAIEMFWINEKDKMENSEISEEVPKAFYKKKTINRKEMKSGDYIDKLIVIVAFIFDINYKTSLKIVEEEKYINRIIERFDFKNEQTKKSIDEIRKFANEYVQEQI